MVIEFTDKTRENDYLDNTSMKAMIHVQRTVDNESTNPFSVEIEGLRTLTDVMFTIRGADGSIPQNYPKYTITGTTVKFSNVAGGFTNALNNIFSIIAYGV